MGEIAQIDISNVDKKTKENDLDIILCNFVDVYHSWAITLSLVPELMKSTANDNQIKRFSLHKGQVAITKDSEIRNDIAVSAYIADELPNVVLGYHCVLITPDENILNGKFLNVIMHSPYAQKYFEANASGSGQRYTLTYDVIANFPVPIPDLEKQKIIGNFFSAIDMKIHNNIDINAELESMAKMIYDYWFLQFDFPDENGKPYKSSGGKMVWNEKLKKEIPEGWEIKKIQDILTPIPITKKYKSDEYEKGNKYPIIDQSAKYICGYTDDENDLLNLEDCIVFGDHTKHIKYVNFAFARGADGTQIINSSINSLPNYILYRQMLDMDLASQGYSRYFKFLKDKYVVIPCKKISDSFMKCIDDSLSKMKHIISENKELEALRDFLLPLLMNGQAGFK